MLVLCHNLPPPFRLLLLFTCSSFFGKITILSVLITWILCTFFVFVFYSKSVRLFICPSFICRLLVIGILFQDIMYPIIWRLHLWLSSTLKPNNIPCLDATYSESWRSVSLESSYVPSTSSHHEKDNQNNEDDSSEGTKDASYYSSSFAGFYIKKKTTR